MNIKTLLIFVALLLTGCSVGEFVDAIFTPVTPEGPAPVDGLSLLGPWGVAGGTLLTSVYSGIKAYGTHKDKKKLVMDLGADTYNKYKSMDAKDKAKLDKDVKGMIPAKYQKYYDLGKEMAG